MVALHSDRSEDVVETVADLVAENYCSTNEETDGKEPSPIFEVHNVEYDTVDCTKATASHLFC